MKRIKAFLLLFCTLFVAASSTSAQEISAKDYFSKAQEAYNAGNCPEAIRLGTEAVKKCEQEFGKGNEYYVLYLSVLAGYYNDIGNYKETIRLDTEAMRLYEKKHGKDKSYASFLGVLASCNALLKNYSESIRLYTESLQIEERVLGKTHPVYLKDRDNLETVRQAYASYASKQMENTSAKEYDSKAEKAFDAKNYTEAIHLETEALQRCEREFGKDHPHYALYLGTLASYYLANGNFQDAIRVATEALHLHEKIWGKDEYYTIILIILADSYLSLGNSSEAIRLYTKVLPIQENIFGKEHPYYLQTLDRLSFLQKHNANKTGR